MTTWVLSDLHLSDDAGAPLFHDDRQGRALEALCARVAGDAVVLLGDAFDFTGMTPPEKGLDAFARALGVTLRPPPRRTPAELAAAVRAANPRALAALAALGERLVVVAGNHDHQLDRAALDAAGLASARLEPSGLTLTPGARVRLQHGHEYDRGNAKPGSPGEVLTQCLHHGVVPALQQLPQRRGLHRSPERVVALRPEESVIPVLERWLRPHDFDRFFRAFLELLAANGFLPHATAWVARIASPEQVKKRVEKADRLWEDVGRRARGMLQDGDADVLVFGHTHVLDWVLSDDDSRLYVNLGTWTERANDAHGALDETLPVLELRELAEGLLVQLHDLREVAVHPPRPELPRGVLQRFVRPQSARTRESGSLPAPRAP